MPYLMIALVWILNFAISFWNAYASGRSWTEAKAAGGWPRLMCWCGAVMSASGFTWCYLILLVLAGYYFEGITEQQAVVAFSLGYILLIPGILLAGFMIMLDSWSRAFRQGGFLNYGIAAYNTYAQVHNTLSAIRGIPQAFRLVRNYFGENRSRSRDDSGGTVVIILLVAVALLGGVLTTAFIIMRTAASLPLPPRPSPQMFADHARNVAAARR